MVEKIKIKENFEKTLKISKENLNLIDQRLKEFKNINASNSNVWFSELCFCILTAQAQAQRAINIQNEIGFDGFLNYSGDKIKKILVSYGHRFYNNKTKYIVEARKYKNIKELIESKSGSEARKFITENIKGLGYKEASHFLRNVGFSDVAIIDRHILRFLLNYGFIKDVPKNITLKKYLKLEGILKEFNIPMDKLDLMIWCHMTGKVLK